MATYQTFAPVIISNISQFQTVYQFFGAGFTTIGWQAQSGHGELPATGTGAAYAFTNPVLPTVAMVPQSAYTYRGAWVSGTTYPNGSNTAGNSADLVTDNSAGGNGITYQKITTNVASNLTTAPHSNATDWQPLQFEIWKSTGGNSGTLPIYVRLTYTTAGAANNTYRIFFQIGTGIDSNGNLTGTIPMTTQTPNNVIMSDNASTTSTTLAEMDFSGDADNFRFIMWRGHTTALNCQTMVVDRSKNSAGQDTDAYFYTGSIINQAGGTILRCSIMPGPSIGNGVINPVNGTGWVGVLWLANSSAPMNNFGATPPIPIFPLLGFVGNPLLGCVGFHAPDVTDGIIMPVWNYGAVHNYLVNKTSTAALSTIDNQGGNGVVPAIL